MRPFKRVKMLDAEEYRVLKKAVASRKIAAGKARRAQIVLLSNQGHTAREIAQRLACNERTALKWISRFNRHGVAGLVEVLREGRLRVYGPEDVGAVIQAALTPPRELGLPFTSWTLDRLVAYLREEKSVGMGRTTCRKERRYDDCSGNGAPAVSRHSPRRRPCKGASDLSEPRDAHDTG